MGGVRLAGHALVQRPVSLLSAGRANSEDTLTTRPKRVVYRSYEHILGLDTVKRIRSQDDVDTFRKDSSEIPHAIVNTSGI